MKTSFLRLRSGKGHFLLSKSSSFVLFTLKMVLLMSTLSFQKVKWWQKNSIPKYFCIYITCCKIAVKPALQSSECFIWVSFHSKINYLAAEMEEVAQLRDE